MLLLVLLLAPCASIRAQRIQGSFEQGVERPERVLLEETWGIEHRAIDSVAVDKKGQFQFPKRSYPGGFYRLHAGGGDVLDLVIDPRESEVVVRFGGRPLQEHVTIVRSDDNQRLWEYKRASRESQAKLAALRLDRQRISLQDREAIAAIEAQENAVRAGQLELQDRLAKQDTNGVFQHLVLAERRLMAAVPAGAEAVRAAMAWSDPLLVRSSTYPKAIMGYLQGLPEPMLEDFMAATDSMLSWASGDTACWRFTRAFLLKAFAQYGPDMVAQHMVDRYLVGSGSLVPPEAELLLLSADLLRVSAGKQAPDVMLVDPVRNDTITLYSVLKQHRYTTLFFYSSTCDHCHGQMPGLMKLFTERAAAGSHVIGIALDADVQEFQETIAAKGLAWPSYSELNGWGAESAKAFAIKSTPTYILIDAQGTIVAKPYDHEELGELLDGLLR
jgi:peroxiredoxin